MSKKPFLSALLIFCIFVVEGPRVAESSPGGSEFYPSSDRGLYIFQAYCVGCHGLSGQGDGPMAAGLERDYGVRPSDLTSEHSKMNMSGEAFKKMVNGGGASVHRTAFMPAWRETLNEKQIADLMAYTNELRTQTRTPEPSITNIADHLELGRVIYGTHCVACHGLSGQGDGPFIQGLKMGEMRVDGHNPARLSADNFFAHRTDAGIEALIKRKKHHSGLQPSNSKWWKMELGDRELSALILYLRTLKLQKVKVEG